MARIDEQHVAGTQPVEHVGRRGLQVGAAGALRGFKDANVPMALNFVAYWLIGFPAAWWFGIHQRVGPS
ncbi:MAG: hypothetical protein HYZ40_20155, partial [Rhodospirillales bacterium]|nr:hypothetical protein [Rhodospirillales bacterium]